MSMAAKIASVALTLTLSVGAIVIGGGAPLSPGKIADSARKAADNSDIAAANTERAARDTEALATIAKNVGSQLQTSRNLLDTQLEIERTSAEGLRRARDLADRIAAIGKVLENLEQKFRTLTGLSARASSSARRSEGAARDLEAVIDLLERRYDVVVDESRELNRKARGYEEVKP